MQSSYQPPIQKHVDKWNLTLEPKTIETFSSVLCFAKQGDRKVVLKLIKPESDELDSAEVLKHFGPDKAVEVLATSPEAILLERIDPGTELKSYVLSGRDDEATVIFCDVMKGIHHGLPAKKFISVEDWQKGFTRHRASGNTQIAMKLVDQAEKIFGELAASQTNRCLLHGDLHYENILWDSVRGWRVIDPKGVIGEPEYEVGNILRNLCERPDSRASSKIIDRRTAIVCEQMGFDRQRVLNWGFAQSVLSVIWSIEDGQSVGTGFAIIEAIASLITSKPLRHRSSPAYTVISGFILL